MQLYNNLSAKEREELISKAGKERLTISFYQIRKNRKPRNIQKSYVYGMERY